jgi:hypothetical protein
MYWATIEVVETGGVKFVVLSEQCMYVIRKQKARRMENEASQNPADMKGKRASTVWRPLIQLTVLLSKSVLVQLFNLVLCTETISMLEKHEMKLS